MKKIFRKISISKNIAYGGLFLFVAVIILGLPQTANADVLDVLWNLGKTAAALPILSAIGVIAALVMVLFGMIDTMIIGALVNISKYNRFISEPAILDAWVVVRDLSNMFFILILLVIAFAAILRIESYQWKKSLPKLLIMAVLINFSRTICGLIIDASQVVMLTFVNTWATTGGDFVDMLKMTGYFGGVVKEEFKKFASADFSILNIVAGMLIGIMFLVISGIVLLVALAVFTMRVVMLWIYIVLSPLAFLLAAFPAGQKYAAQWWSEFTKYVVSGPILAFFIWLALIASRSITEIGGIGNEAGKDQCFGLTPGMCLSNFLPFIISIGMLVGGLMITQQVGGAIGSAAGKGLDWAKRASKFVGKKTYDNYLTDKLQHAGIVDYNLPRLWKGIQEKRADIKKKRYGEGMVASAERMREKGRFFGALAMTGTPGSAWEQLTTRVGWSRRLTGGKNAQKQIKNLAKERRATKDSIEKIKDDKDYKEAIEISEAMFPQQRHDMRDEQKKLTSEIEKLDKDMKSWVAEITAAKSSDDSISERIATEELESLKKQRELKLNTFSNNEQVLSQPGYSAYQINEAKKRRESFEADINAKKKDINLKNDQILKYKPIVDFEAISMQGALENEEMKKVDHIKDRDELASMLRDAMKNNDKTRFSAIALKLAKDGNENDGVLNNLGFSSNAEGLQDLIKSISSKAYVNNKGETVKTEDNHNYMGFSDQAAKALGMKISYAAEAVNHWGTARAFTMEDGSYRDSNKYEQAIAAVSEIAKMDPQQIGLRLNRLGYGGESPDGEFTLNEFGLAILKAVGPKVAQQMNRFNPNAAARLSTPENIKLMVKVGVAPEFIGELQAKGKTKVMTVGDAIEDLKEKGYYKK